MQPAQQLALATTMDTLNMDVCCLSETRLRDTASTTQLFSPTSKRMYFLHCSNDAVSETSGQAGVGIALSHQAKSSLIDWIPINSRLCTVRLESSIKKGRNNEKMTMFVISAPSLTDCSSHEMKDEFYFHLTNLLHKARRTDIVVLAGDLNAQVGRLDADERRLGGPHSIGTTRTDNVERLLHLCTDSRTVPSQY